jgi:hypothetical protein
MAVTQNTYTGNGSTVLFSFTFPYLETTDIKVSVNGALTTSYTLANPTTVQFNTAPASGAIIRIYRDTNLDLLSATFFPGSAIRANDLNTNFLQSNYSAQEVANRSLDPTNAIFTGDINLSGFRVTNLANGTAATDAVNKGQLEASQTYNNAQLAATVSTTQGYATAASTSAQLANTLATQAQQSATNASSASTAALASATASSTSASSAATSASNAASFVGKTVFLGFTRNLNGTLSLTWSSPSESTTYATSAFEYKNESQWLIGSNDLLHTSGTLIGQPKISFNSSGHLIISA